MVTYFFLAKSVCMKCMIFFINWKSNYLAHHALHSMGGHPLLSLSAKWGMVIHRIAADSKLTLHSYFKVLWKVNDNLINI